MRLHALAGLTLLAVASASSGEVRFLSPRSGMPALGTTRVELAVLPPLGATVLRVTVEVDGQQVAELGAPPWETSFEAGEGQRDHVVAATAFFSDGTQAVGGIRVSAVRFQQTMEVSLVSFSATVRDGSGGLVTDLGPADFRLTENGRAETIERLSTERRPLRVALVMDTSLSMTDPPSKLAGARSAALGFLDVLTPEDRALVVGFSDQVRVLRPMTSDRAALRRAIEGIEARGGTALYDAIWKAADLLGDEDGRKVLVLLSDGRDEGSSGIEPGSLHTLGDAMQQALRREVMVYSIGLGDFGTATRPLLDFYDRTPVRDILAGLAQATGGEVLFLKRPKQLRDAFARVGEALRNQYAIAYTSDDESRDGTWRETRLEVLRPGLKVTARRGYYAPKASSLQ
jgi:Ca-activated chloride channel family protein